MLFYRFAINVNDANKSHGIASIKKKETSPPRVKSLSKKNLELAATHLDILM